MTRSGVSPSASWIVSDGPQTTLSRAGTPTAKRPDRHPAPSGRQRCRRRRPSSGQLAPAAARTPFSSRPSDPLPPHPSGGPRLARAHGPTDRRGGGGGGGEERPVAPRAPPGRPRRPALAPCQQGEGRGARARARAPPPPAPPAPPSTRRRNVDGAGPALRRLRGPPSRAGPASPSPAQRAGGGARAEDGLVGGGRAGRRAPLPPVSPGDGDAASGLLRRGEGRGSRGRRERASRCLRRTGGGGGGGRRCAPPAPCHGVTVPSDLRWLPPSAGPAGAAAASGPLPVPAPLTAVEEGGGRRCVAVRGMVLLLRVFWRLCGCGGRSLCAAGRWDSAAWGDQSWRKVGDLKNKVVFVVR